MLERPVSPLTLAELLDADAGGLAVELERLCERRLLAIDGPGFRFRYDIVRGVLSETLSPARRALLLGRAERFARGPAASLSG